MWPDRNAKWQSWTMNHITVQNHLYSFKCYGSKLNRRVIYRCIHGSRNASNPCSAVLKIDYSIDMKNFEWKLTKPHTCQNQNNLMKKFFYSDEEINNMIVSLYNDPENKGQPEMIFNKLLNIINKNLPNGMAKNPIPISRVRRYVHKLAKLDPKNVISHERCKTVDNEPFLLFSVKIKEKPIYGFASDFMLQRVEECQVIGIDGTFHTAPESFFQICIFIGRTEVMNLPLLYVILPNKKYQTYVLAFQTYLNCLRASNIRFNCNLKIICDFENAEIKSIKNVFTNEYKDLQLCYYHYCRNTYDKLNSLAKSCCFTKDLYQIIVLLPLINIRSAERFILFLKRISHYSFELTEFVDYFEKTYVKQYKISDWNIYGKTLGHRATNNSNESFNKKLNTKLCKSPSIEYFVNEIIKLENEFKNKYNNYLLDKNMVDKDFKNDLSHNEIQRFCNSINFLRRKYQFFESMLKEEGTVYFDVEDSSQCYVTQNFTIEIPCFDLNIKRMNFEK